ncbi:MAG: flagellar hook-length control protein FliK [Planctomycetales bacterium]|nr:flagellar hook-length control protein FliK [Planctomycetales bacterium]
MSADSTRRTSARFHLSSRAGSAQSLQSSLFEQLLSLPAPLSVQREPTSAARSNDIDPSSRSNHRSDSASLSASESTSAAKSSSADGRSENEIDDVGSTAEDKAEKGATEGQVALLNATPAIDSAAIQETDDDATANGTMDAQAAQKEQSAQNSKDTGSASKQSVMQAAEADSDTDQPQTGPQAEGTDQPQTGPQAEGADATSTSAGGRSVSTSSTHSVEGQGGDQGGQQVAQVQTTEQAEFLTNDSAEATDAQEGDQVRAESGSHIATDAGKSPSGQKPVTAATSGDGKSRSDRREKWFERGADRPASTFGAQHNSATNEEVQAASTPDNHGGEDSTATATADSVAAMAQPNPSVDSINQSLDTALVAVGASMIAAETTVASGANASSAVISMDSASSLGGDLGTNSTTAPEGVDAKNNATSAQRADARPATSETQRPDALTQAERVRLVQRVSRSFSRLGPMGGQINIRLHPPQLGSLNVQVRMEGRTMTAKLTTETSTARDVILESLPVLRSRLAEQGFQISSFHVEVADNNADAAGGNGNPQASHDQSNGREGGYQSSRDVDYRRLAAQQQLPGRYDATTDGIAPRELAWQMLAGVDLQA